MVRAELMLPGARVTLCHLASLIAARTWSEPASFQPREASVSFSIVELFIGNGRPSPRNLLITPMTKAVASSTFEVRTKAVVTGRNCSADERDVLVNALDDR